MGGGSADAAVALMGLNEFWECGLPEDRLMSLAAGLGCDVPALLHGGAVCMEGLGENVTPLEVCGDKEKREWSVVILNPGFRVSTADVYARCTSALTSGDGRYRNIVSALRAGDVALAGRSLRNGLQETVFNKYPLIRMMAESLEVAGALGTLVSGSGASVFGLASDPAHAEEIEERAKARLPVPIWSWITRTLPDGVTAAHGPLEARV